MARSKWLTVAKPRPEARLRLVCFPHAGAGGSAYRRWPAMLPDWIEVAAAALPGREARLREPAVPALADLLPGLRAGLAADLEQRPFALLGHSMGALIAFELARALDRDGGPVPRALVVSGHRPPHIARPRLDVPAMTGAQFMTLIAGFGGTPPELLAQPELLELFLPVLRADITLVETYTELAPGERVPCPVIAYGGAGDPHATSAEMPGWARYTSAAFRSRTFDGGHFFLHDAPQAVGCLAGDLVAAGAVPGAPGQRSRCE